jgi:hypothetical protein
MGYFIVGILVDAYAPDTFRVVQVWTSDSGEESV